MWCRAGGVGARSRKRAGLGYRLVRKHARTEMLGILTSMLLLRFTLSKLAYHLVLSCV